MSLSTHQVQEMAQQGRDDPYFFTRGILGYERLTREIHGRWFEWLADFSTLRKLRLAPRGTYKTTVGTVGFPLWVLIQDKPIVRGLAGKNLRILIANAVQARAMDMLREIDGHIRRNQAFIACYGDLYSDKQWTGSQKTIATRTINRKEPSLQAVGKGGQLTSAHYDIMLLDDLCNERDRNSVTEREKTIQWIKDALSLLEPGGLVVIQGTRWHWEDVYNYVMEQLNPQLVQAGQAPYQVVSEGCYLEDGETPRFPTILPVQALENLKVEKGFAEFNSQYLNTPMPPDSQLFHPNQLQYYTPAQLPPPNELEYFLFVDPSLGRSATSDFSAILTVARHQRTGQLYLIDADLERRPTEKLKRDILPKIAHYRPTRAGFETNGFQIETLREVERFLAEQGVAFRFKEVENMGDKIARIQADEGFIKAVHYPQDWQQVCPELMRQLFQFPTGNHDDGPDALQSLLAHLIGKNPKGIKDIFRHNVEEGAGGTIGAGILKEQF